MNFLHISRLITLVFVSSTLFMLNACGTANTVNKKSPSKGSIIETGVASWYGPNFHGKLTANGEKYDMYGLTAAHRTLPFNSIVEVQNLDNGKSVEVRINDRGPFAKNRIIDLSKRAAQEIDMLGPGTAIVQLVLKEGTLKSTRSDHLTVATYTIQLGSFQSEHKALQLATKIEGAHLEDIRLNGRKLYRVYYGIYTDKDKAEKKRRELKRKGFNGYVKQIENG